MRMLLMVVLALLIGFVSYRAALATMSTEQFGAASFRNCTGIVSPAHFDAVTGVPVAPSCTFSDGRVLFSLYAGDEVYGHFARSFWFGLAVVPVAFIALWWFGRRRLSGLDRRIEALPSA